LIKKALNPVPLFLVFVGSRCKIPGFFAPIPPYNFYKYRFLGVFDVLAKKGLFDSFGFEGFWRPKHLDFGHFRVFRGSKGGFKVTIPGLLGIFGF